MAKKKKDFVMRELERFSKQTAKDIKKARNARPATHDDLPPSPPPTEEEIEEMARRYEEEQGAELIQKDALAKQGQSPF